MKWQQPIPGESRKRSWFLILPKTINGKTRWLEWAEWKEVYVVAPCSLFTGWYPIKWIN